MTTSKDTNDTQRSSEHNIAMLVIRRSESITLRLNRRWPGIDRHRVENAVFCAYEVMLKNRSKFNTIYTEQGEQAIEKLIYTIAWRQLNGWYRRKSTRCELGSDDRPVEGYQDAGHDHWIQLQALSELIDRASRQYGGRKVTQLSDALAQRLIGGEPDHIVAEQHGVHRTQVCKARNMVRREVLGR